MSIPLEFIPLASISLAFLLYIAYRLGAEFAHREAAKSVDLPEKTKPTTAECFHALDIIVAQPFVIVGESAEHVSYPAQTVILYRCSRCLGHSSQVLTGMWTTHQLLLKENELATLEGMAR